MNQDDWQQALQALGDAPQGEDATLQGEAQLWQAHQACTEGCAQIVESTSRAAAFAARQGKLIEALLEAANNGRSQTQALQVTLTRISDAFDRLRLIALNVGLEGARNSNVASRALSSVADEVRGCTERGDQALRDLQAVVDEMVPTVAQAVDRGEQIRSAAQELGEQASRSSALALELRQSTEQFGSAARKVTKTDPQIACTLAGAAEHARQLAQAVATLQSSEQRALARAMLLPVADPLVRVLLEMIEAKHAR